MVPSATLKEFIWIGGAIGAGGSQLVEAWVDSLMSPLTRRIKHYSKVVEIALAVRIGHMPPEQARVLLAELQAEYFLGDTKIARTRGMPRAPKNLHLPPPTPEP